METGRDLVRGVGGLPHRQSDFLIETLEGTPVPTNCLAQNLPLKQALAYTPDTLERVYPSPVRQMLSLSPFYSWGH